MNNIGIIGNTKLTLKGLEGLLAAGHRVSCVFGLPDSLINKKVNATSLDMFCHQHDIVLDRTGDWKFLLDKGLELLVGLGDSRIVPELILHAIPTIGNHGAVLPFVQGGASLVWGRMLNLGYWGVSIMELNKTVDSGRIIKTATFQYENDCTMESFVNLADDVTITLLLEYLKGDYTTVSNKAWDVRVNKHVDAECAVSIMKQCLLNKQCVYMPPRCEQDGRLLPHWGDAFKHSFKIANDFPYPKWFETT